MDITQKNQPVVRALPFQTIGEEIANAILHGLGAMLAVAGLVMLVLRGRGQLGGIADIRTMVAFTVFATTMIVMFLASTLYHAVQHKGAKRVLRVLDHSAIYLLIAGTYTPFCLLGLRGGHGWILFAIEWACAVTGITLYATNCTFIKKFELIIYLIMGWAIVFGWSRLSKVLPTPSLIMLICGGAAYSLGTIWYAMHNRRKMHVVWHVFVLIGAICHWASVWFM
jgi:hemolysin III